MNRQLKHAIIFLISTFICTWIFYFSLVFLKLNPYQGTGMVLLLLGGSAPTYVGIIMAMLTYKKPQRLDYLKRTYNIRLIKPFWWCVILLLSPVIVALSIGLDALLGGTVPAMTMLRNIFANPLLFFPYILLSFMSGPFSEELGWRGFALTPLLERFGFIKASVILGFVWGLWHLPLYFMPQTWHGQMGFQLAGFWMFMLMSIGLSIIMSLVYINTNQSILSAMLMHLTFNFSSQLVAEASARFELLRSLLIVSIGIVICLYMVRMKRSNAKNDQLSAAS